MEDAPHLSPRDRLLVDLVRQVPGGEMAMLDTYNDLLRVGRGVAAGQEAFLGRYGLSEGKLVVLQLLHQAPDERLTPSALAEAAGVARGTMTGLLAGLGRAGLVTRTAHPEDGRMATIELTAAARELFERILPERVAHIMGFMAALTADEQRQLRACLARLARGLSALDAP